MYKINAGVAGYREITDICCSLSLQIFVDMLIKGKKITVIVLLFLCSHSGFSQTMPDFSLIKLDRPADYKKAEPFALQTAVFLLMSPYKNSETDTERGKCIEFLAKWMSGTNDYSFSITATASKIAKNDVAILEMYITSMVKYAIENKEAAKDAKVLKLNAVTVLINYCEDRDHNIKMNKPVKKLAEAKAKGELEKVLEEY